MVALRPANAGGWPGTSEPLSNLRRSQRRAQSGTSLLDHDRSSASASAGKFSSRQATKSARKASTSASNVSCTPLPAGPQISKDFYYQQNENSILTLRKLQSPTRWPRGSRGPQWQGVLRYSQFMFSPIGKHPSRR